MDIAIHDRGKHLSGIVTFTVKNIIPENVQKYLSTHPRRMNVSCSRFNSTFIDMKNRGLDAVVRASVHAYNSEEEIDTLLNVLADIR